MDQIRLLNLFLLELSDLGLYCLFKASKTFQQKTKTVDQCFDG